MADVDEIIDYIKSLKRGFDKDLFERKIDELGYLVETIGINYDDFQTLFKVWLNLTIPIPKWVYLGTCIVPQGKVKKNTIEYSLQWILANYDSMNTTRIRFLLDWLTAAMNTDSVEMESLDIGYEVFYSMLTYEALTSHVIKLLYTLTKPADITRKRVLELIDLAKKREGKKNMLKQIQVLLGLFKSHKPQYVPENIPSISKHTVFRNIDIKILKRFEISQTKRNSMSIETRHLFWMNPLNSISRNKKADPLVPDMEFLNIGSQQYDDSSKKNYLDFSDPVLLLQYSNQHAMYRPARLRALLCNPAGLTLLVMASEAEHAFLSQDLYHLLVNFNIMATGRSLRTVAIALISFVADLPPCDPKRYLKMILNYHSVLLRLPLYEYCFLEPSPHSYTEKQDYLYRLTIYQATLLQGIPVVTKFLAQFLPFWNEKDYFAEILKLMEWVNVERADHVQVILDTMTKLYHRAQPLEQCAILNSLTTMYTNLVYASTRRRHYFLSMCPSQSAFTKILTMVACNICDMSNKGLQASPDSVCVMYSALRASAKQAHIEAWCGRAAASIPGLLSLALPLLSVSAVALDSIADLFILYKEIFSATKAKAGCKDQQYVDHMQILKRYTSDFISCLFLDEFLSERKKGIVFNKLHPQMVSKLYSLIPDADSTLSIRKHLAFAPYMNVQGLNAKDTSNKIWFHAVIEDEFLGLSQFVKQAMPGLQ